MYRCSSTTAGHWYLHNSRALMLLACSLCRRPRSHRSWWSPVRCSSWCWSSRILLGGAPIDFGRSCEDLTVGRKKVGVVVSLLTMLNALYSYKPFHMVEEAVVPVRHFFSVSHRAAPCPLCAEVSPSWRKRQTPSLSGHPGFPRCQSH